MIPNRFLLEIYTEEIPASLQSCLHDDIPLIFKESLKSKNIDTSNINFSVYSTSNRMIVYLENIPEKTLELELEKKGPKEEAKEEVIQAFLKSNGITKDQCRIKDIKGTNFLFAVSKVPSRSALEVLQEVVLELFKGYSFKQSMFWNSSKSTWARPIRSIVSILEVMDEKLFLNIEYANIKSSNFTFAHKFIKNHEKIIVSGIDDYFYKLQDNNVIISPDVRKNIITMKVQEIEKKYNIKANLPDALIRELVYISEYPVPIVAEIEEKYLDLPKELLVEVLNLNQKYITFKDSEKLSKYFIFISNIVAEDDFKKTIKGNIKVLKARLEDAVYFVELDKKNCISSSSEKLKEVVFFKDLGTMYDKTKRVEALFQKVFNEDQSLLCSVYKADLVSQMVFEIPSLQGIMGGYYLLNSNLENKEELAQAVTSHYSPKGPNDNIPETLLGAKLALLDKLDTLISFFSINKKPTGSKDPYALRREALGIIRIILEYKLDIKLQQFISSDLQEFFKDRLSVYLSSNYDVELVKDIISKNNELDICSIYSKVERLSAFSTTQKGKDVISVFHRLNNIITSLNISSNEIDDTQEFKGSEKKVYDEFCTIKDNISNNKDIDISLIAPISGLINEYLDNNHINVEEESIRKERFSLILFLHKNLLKILFN